MPLTSLARDAIFSQLKDSLKKVIPPMVVATDKKGVFELIGNIPVPYGSRKVIIPGMYFSSVVAHREMVSFHFAPLYYHEAD